VICFLLKTDVWEDTKLIAGRCSCADQSEGIVRRGTSHWEAVYLLSNDDSRKRIRANHIRADIVGNDRDLEAFGFIRIRRKA
jgi:hypothetical protein